MKALWKISALAVVAIGGVAQADVIPTNTATGSNLVLFVRDTTDGANPNRVYARGFSVTVDDILTQAGVSGAGYTPGQAVSFNLPPSAFTADPALGTFLSGGTSFVWTIMAADTAGTNPFQQRYVTTTPANFGTDPIPDNATLTSVWSQVAPMFNSLNGNIPGTALGSPLSISTNAQWGQVGQAYENAGDWFAGGVQNANVLGETANFYLLASSDTFEGRYFSLGTVTLNLDGSLTQVSNAPPTVPLPPALYLLGSAFAGLAGVARRRKQAAAATNV